MILVITRQSVYEALYTLKETGVSIDKYINLLSKESGIPNEVLIFLRDNSPQFQFFRYIQQHQKALMKSILDYKELDNHGKIKVLSSIITRVMIAIEYNNLSESLIDALELSEVSKAINQAVEYNDYSLADKVLEKLNTSMKLFVKKRD